MKYPKKLIYKYKNTDKKIQHQLYIYIGYIVDDKILKILDKISNDNIYDTFIKLSINDNKILEDYYGNNWYNYFFISNHIIHYFNKIDESNLKKNNLIQKFGKNWYNDNIIKKINFKNIMISHEFLYKKEKETREKEKEENEENNYNFSNKDYINNISGGYNQNYEENSLLNNLNYINYKNNSGGTYYNSDDNDVNEMEIDSDSDLIDNTKMIDKNIQYDDNDEFDMEEIENMYKDTDIDVNIKSTSNMINNLIKTEYEQYSDLIEFDKSKDNLNYDENIIDVYKKNYIINDYLYDDDSIKTIKEKICNTISLNSIFNINNNIINLIPSRIYLYCKYEIYDIELKKNNENYIMLGQKWIKKNELLKINVMPINNLKIYENLKGELLYLQQDLKKYGSKIRLEDDNNNLLEHYQDYHNNEIYMLDIYNELGQYYNYDKENETKLKNLYDTYIKIYFPQLNYDNLKNIINFLNKKNYEKELELNESIFITIKNDLILEKEIYKLIESTEIKKNIFKENYITHCVIHYYLIFSSTYSYNKKLDLFRIFDNFKLNETYPFLQYQLPDGKMIYKIVNNVNMDENTDKEEILSKWFENSPYGISFKIKVNYKGINNKYIAISLNENGRLIYKMQWKEEDKAKIEDIYDTYEYIKILIKKINNENIKFNIEIPQNKNFTFAFINSIQKFEFPDKMNINHNDLSDLARYFYPYLSLVIDPKKRSSKNIENNSSKFGTYLRYKKVDKYDNESKIHYRILYFMKNYEYNEELLINEISRQFNITESESKKKIEEVKIKYPVIKKTRKILKKFDKSIKYNQPGIGVDIQGKSRLNYKIRISGARNKNQMDRIITLISKFICIYIDIYLNKNKNMQLIKKKINRIN